MGRSRDDTGVSRRLALVLVALLVGAGVISVIAMVVGGDDDDASPRTASSSTTTTHELGTDAEELLARLATGRQAAVHVRLASAEDALAGGTVTVEIWRDGDRVRQDVRLDSATALTEVSAFQLEDGNVICQREGEGPWACQRAASVATENGDPVGLIEAAAANLQGADVTGSDDEIAGTPVRCYSIERPDGSSELCLTEDGVPMRLATEGQVLTATSVEREVAGDVFTPPAEITEG